MLYNMRCLGDNQAIGIYAFFVVPEMPLGTVVVLSISLVGIALLWLRCRENVSLAITP